MSTESIFTKFIDDFENEPPKVDPAAELLKWITHKWNGDTITLRDVYRHGPSFLRDDRESAFNLAKVLTQRGNLVPLKPHRSDRRLWHVVREPIRK
jgi:hypothetical protein